ncbi:MAG: chromate efflux transporter, partial [Myxococcales bacterium]
MHDTASTSELAPLPLPREQRERWPSFLRSMAWVGLNSFGGPVAQIGVMHEEAVEKRRWLTDGQFVHLLNFANILPGPEALEIAIHLGYLRRGVAGGIVAGLLFILPGFVSLTALAWVYLRWGTLAEVDAVLSGVRPVGMALIAAAAVRISSKALTGTFAYLLCGGAFAAKFFFDVPFVLLLVACGLCGVALAGHRARTPARALHRWAFVAAIALSVAAQLAWRGGTPATQAAVVARTPVPGPSATFGRYVEIAWVNTKAALVTFGGAYTVLPYLREQAVAVHGWVTDQQVVDSLALAETTPGPLISVGVFLSYLAGGFTGAVLGCFFLFLPSFVFVLALGRYIHAVERLPRAGDSL